MNPTTILIGLLVLVVLFLIYLYNSLVLTRNRTQNALKDIDIQLRRRFELIPNLVETVKGVAKQEKELFGKVSEARAGLVTGSLNDKLESNNQLTDTLKSVFAVAEAYPEMKSNESFQKLHDELIDTQNKIMASQRFYQSMVQAYDTKLQSFPTNIFAKMFGFDEKDFEYIEVSETEKENIKVNFD